MSEEGAPRRERTRREDHPDWKMAAPRWLLVAGVTAGFLVAGANLRTLLETTSSTAAEIGPLKARMARAEHSMVTNSIQVAQVRVDSLRWQVHSSARLMPGDSAFQEDLRDRLRDAERTLARLQREELELEQGNR